jgi:hypothetical protein
MVLIKFPGNGIDGLKCGGFNNLLWVPPGVHGGVVVEALCYNQKVAGSIPDGVTGFFH